MYHLCIFTHPGASVSFGFAQASLARSLGLYLAVGQHCEWFKHTGM